MSATIWRDLNCRCRAAVALSFNAVHGIASGDMPDMQALCWRHLAIERRYFVCGHPQKSPDWGGPGADSQHRHERYALPPARRKHRQRNPLPRSICASSNPTPSTWPGSTPDMFDDVSEDPVKGSAGNLCTPMPKKPTKSSRKTPATQLAEVLRSMARAWEGHDRPAAAAGQGRARRCRSGPCGAGTGAWAGQAGECGSGVMQLVNSETGVRQITGRYLSQSQGREALTANGRRDLPDPRSARPLA